MWLKYHEGVRKEVAMRLQSCEIFRNIQCGEVTLVLNGRWGYLYGQTSQSAEKVRNSLLREGSVPDALIYEIAPAHRRLLVPVRLKRVQKRPTLRKAA
jgi:hypothetical protein